MWMLIGLFATIAATAVVDLMMQNSGEPAEQIAGDTEDRWQEDLAAFVRSDAPDDLLPRLVYLGEDSARGDVRAPLPDAADWVDEDQGASLDTAGHWPCTDQASAPGIHAADGAAPADPAAQPHPETLLGDWMEGSSPVTIVDFAAQDDQIVLYYDPALLQDPVIELTRSAEMAETTEIRLNGEVIACIANSAELSAEDILLVPSPAHAVQIAAE